MNAPIDPTEVAAVASIIWTAYGLFLALVILPMYARAVLDWHKHNRTDRLCAIIGGAIMSPTLYPIVAALA